MAEPRSVTPASSAIDIYSLSIHFHDLLNTIQAQSQQNDFTTLQCVLNMLRNTTVPTVRTHTPYCRKLLPYIQQGVQTGKLNPDKTRELVQRFLDAGIFKQLDPTTKVSQVRLCNSSSEKVTIARLPLQLLSGQFAQFWKNE